MVAVDTAEVLQTGRDAGLAAVGVTSADAFEEARATIEGRRQAGLHAGMAFTYRNPARSCSPRHTLPSARSLVVGALDFHREHRDGPAVSTDEPRGRVAAYAREDHYDALRSALSSIAGMLTAAGHRALVVADQNNLVDRAAAHRAGLGWWGKSANILVPGVGSMVVLGSVITDAELELSEETVPDGCGTCRECLDGCPTGAIVEPGTVDARRCLAWLVQAEGIFPPDLRVALGDRLYGCDDCQDVCPPNRVRIRRPAAPSDAPSSVPVLEVLSASDADLMDRYGRWYVPNREPRYLRRNALIVLGNVGDAGAHEVRGAIGRYLADPDPMLRAHAVWAAKRCGLAELVPGADGSAEVDDEIDRPVDPR